MTKSKTLSLFFSVMLIVVAVGCASAPTAEIDATKTALGSVQSDGDVNTYAPDSLKAAEDALSNALAEVQAQDAKFALSRNYDQSVALLKSAKDLAETAKNEAQVNKAKAKADAEAAIAALPAIIEEATTLLAKAPRGKDTRADIEAMNNDLKLAQETAQEATDALSAERYLDAIAKAGSSKDKATTIIEQVKAAQQKTRR